MTTKICKWCHAPLVRMPHEARSHFALREYCCRKHSRLGLGKMIEARSRPPKAMNLIDWYLTRYRPKELAISKT